MYDGSQTEWADKEDAPKACLGKCDIQTCTPLAQTTTASPGGMIAAHQMMRATMAQILPKTLLANIAFDA